MIPSVSAGVMRWTDSAPPAQTAGVTDGATGVTSSHVVPTRVTVNVAVTRSTCVQPAGIWPHANPSLNVAVIVTVVSTVPAYVPWRSTA